MKQRSLTILISCLLSLFCSSRVVSAQLEMEKAIHLPRVQGTVYDKTGKLLPDAKVELVRNDAVVFTTTTDQSGGFGFKHVSGLYTLRVREEKHSPAAREIKVELELASAAQNRNLFVLLGPAACSESCSTITTSRKEFETVVRRNTRQ
jgi:hypothetical protein